LLSEVRVLPNKIDILKISIHACGNIGFNMSVHLHH